MFDRVWVRRRGVEPAADVTAEIVRRASTNRSHLVVGARDDPEERTADALADTVVARLDGRAESPGPPLRRASSRVRRSPLSNGGDLVGGTAAPPSVERRIRRSPAGRPLEPTTRQRFESAMDADLGRVRIHRGPDADALNTDLSAKAFTVGNDVYFSRGSYAPATHDGQRLLAHELAHTLQGDGASARRVVRRFSLDNPDFSRTQRIEVFGTGASGTAARFHDADGRPPLIVKVDQLTGPEVVVAGNLHQAAARSNRGAGRYWVTAPPSRLATPSERAAIQLIAEPLIGAGAARAFLTKLNSPNPIVLQYEGRGDLMQDVIQAQQHTRKSRRLGRLKSTEQSLLFDMCRRSDAITTLAQSVPVDVIMLMADRLIGKWNPENFLYDAASGRFAFHDNTLNGPGGFLRSAALSRGSMTAREHFDDWTKSEFVRALRSDPPRLATMMVDNMFNDEMYDDKYGNDISGDLAEKDRPGADLLRKEFLQHRKKMIGWATRGIEQGRDTVIALLGNPRVLVDGIDDADKPEVAHSLLARRLFLLGFEPDDAWARAQLDLHNVLPARAAGAPPPGATSYVSPLSSAAASSASSLSAAAAAAAAAPPSSSPSSPTSWSSR